MSTSSPSSPSHDYDAFPPVTLVQLADRFGDIPATRICMNPPPGQATEEDMLYFQEHEGRLFELVDGTLIEKAMGNFESLIASTVHGLLFIYLRANPIGKSLMADTQLKLRRGPFVCQLLVSCPTSGSDKVVLRGNKKSPLWLPISPSK